MSNDHKRALVVGAGIAGIQAALDLAEAGTEVFLVERGPSIGGRMAQLDKTFPTNDCAMCILSPKLVEVSKHPNINLLTNACHALEDGGQLTVVTRRQSSDMVAFEIADTGSGIPTDDLPSIFDPFFTTKTPGEGAGLGLSIVKKIVDSHNGTIMVESEPGRGSTFCIVLPTGHDDRT